ncbi:hypothetical protein [Amphibacillus cookii]|uniref:hypothetical protein n=1 Tax=Amphibacillus cookii TaxID=767787 RepID=UPI00195BE1DA|nr:hypothetical protein [Amphibacillus cookii]MBM7542356.1 hypothetical protein [Amphibacillus cookii]
MTLYEYKMRMRAFRLQRIDDEYDMHLQAWLHQQVKATKEKGKRQVPVFQSFKQFYDYDKRIKEIERPIQKKVSLSTKQKNMAKAAYVANLGREV